MENKDKLKAEAALWRLSEKYPDAVCSLDSGGDAWRLLVMTRLSAQCTDERVNKVAPELFGRFPTPQAMADAEIEEIEEKIRSCGLYHSKAKSLKELSNTIFEKYGGKVPDTMEELLSLPGVGRKTANLVLGDVYNKGGIVADTHCMRICERLGFLPLGKKDPLKTEKVMSKLINSEAQSAFCHRLVLFGREVCRAAKPECDGCIMSDICDFAKERISKINGKKD